MPKEKEVSGLVEPVNEVAVPVLPTANYNYYNRFVVIGKHIVSIENVVFISPVKSQGECRSGYHAFEVHLSCCKKMVLTSSECCDCNGEILKTFHTILQAHFHSPKKDDQDAFQLLLDAQFQKEAIKIKVMPV